MTGSRLKMSLAAQVLQQAEALKVTVADASSGSNEAWVSRQTLRDLYQTLLVMDLEYALDKKVEQDLWNHAFKNQINSLQVQAKEKQNPKRSEIQASLNLFLETASGFYNQLLQELCTAFELDLPFRRHAASYGILKEHKPLNSSTKVRTPKRSSCLYVCQHCLVHLGDIARYRQQTEQAQSFYRHAARLVPYNGQPYNQLAILEAAKGNKLATVFYYILSIAVKHPFPAASTNLEKFYSKLTKDGVDHKGKFSASEMIGIFLQFHALVHASSDLDRARSSAERMKLNLPGHIASGSLSSIQLLRMLAINLFAMHHASRKLICSDESSKESKEDSKDSGIESKDSGEDTKDLAKDPKVLEGEDKESDKDAAKDAGNDVKGAEGKTEVLSQEEERCFDMVLNFTVAFFDHLLHLIPKQEQKARESHTLPAIKLVVDWLTTDRDLLKKPVFTSHMIWPNMAKLLNNLQYQKEDSTDMKKYANLPLPEDGDLQHFIPVQKVYSGIEFNPAIPENMSPEEETKLRCSRIVQQGLWIADNYPMSCFLKYQKGKSGKIQFTAPMGLPIKPAQDVPGKTPPVRSNPIQAILQKPISSTSDDVGKKPAATSPLPSLLQKPADQKVKPSASVPIKDAKDVKKSTVTFAKGSPPQGIAMTTPVIAGANALPAKAGPGIIPIKNANTSQPPPPLPPNVPPPPGPGAMNVPPPLGVLPFDPSIPPPNVRPPFDGVPPPFPPGQNTMPPFKGIGIPPPNRTSPFPGLPATSPPNNPLISTRQPPPPLPVGTPPRGMDHPPPPFNDPKLFSNLTMATSPPQGPPPYPPVGNPPNFPPSAIFGSLDTPPPNFPTHHSAGEPSPLFNPLLNDTRYPPPSDPSRPFSQMPPPSFPRNDFNKPDVLKKPPDLTSLNIQPPSDSSSFPFRNFDFVSDYGFNEGIPKPDSPPSIGRSLFSDPAERPRAEEQSTANTYQLFSESPWSVPIKPRTEAKSPSVSPFASSGSSVRTTPDLLRAENQDPAIVAAGMPIGRPPPGGLDSDWGSLTNPGAGGQSVADRNYLAAEIQSIWASGPSPLEKLLEQQKMQRHNDPH